MAEPHFPVFPEFKGTSYSQRYEFLLRKLMLEKLYNGVAFLRSTEKGGRRGDHNQPAPDLSMKKLLAGLAGHVQSYLAGI